MYKHLSFTLIFIVLFLSLSEASTQQYFPQQQEVLPTALRTINVASNSALNSAINNALPGDRIIIANGNYNGISLIGLEGTANNPIIFVAANPHQAIISGSTGGRNARLSDCAHVEFHNVRFTNASVWGVGIGPVHSTDTAIGCHNIRIINCEIDNAGQELLVVNGNSYNIEIIGNTLHDSGMAGSGKPYAEGIYVGSGKTGSDRSHDILIQGNHLYKIGNQSNWGEAIDIKVQAYNITIVDNLIEDVVVHSQGAITALINDKNYPVGQTNPNILISRNVIHNVRRSSSGWDGAGIFASANGITITNNLIWDTDQASIMATRNASNTTGNFIVYNNTLWEGIRINETSIGGANSSVDPILQNNLIRGVGASAADMIVSSADFIGPVSGDAIADTYIGSGFQLHPNSPAIGLAQGDNLVSYDLTGSTRPSSGYSLGAFEVESVVVDPPAVLYTVAFTSSEGGSIEGNIYQEVPEGDTSDSVNVVTDSGYQFAGWSGDYNGDENSLTLSNVSQDFNITANFVEDEATSSPTPVEAINCGGPSVLSGNGVSYRADTFYIGGTTANYTDEISGTEDDALFQSERYGTFSYAIPLPNGNYTVTLYFAENYWTNNGKRIFDGFIEDQIVADDLDIHQVVGPDAAYSVAVPVILTDGVLSMNFSASQNHAKLSAILIETPADGTGGGVDLTDSDSDGMPDSFEMAHGLNSADESDAQDDKDKDGLPNLLEYAFKLNASDSSDAQGNRPTVGIASSGTNQHLQITFRRMVGGIGSTTDGYISNGIRYQVNCRASLNSGSWETGSALLQEVGSPIDNGDGTEMVTVRIRATINDSTSMFLCLSVSGVSDGTSSEF